LIESASKVPITTPNTNLITVIPLVQNESFTFNKFLLFAGIPMRDRAQVADDTRVEGRFLATYRTGIDKWLTAFRASAEIVHYLFFNPFA
jgi:hypothetical protein